MMLGQPLWLILFIPFGLAWVHWRLPTPTLRVLRAIAGSLVILALCQPSLRLPSREGVVVVAADRSRSMPPTADGQHQETIRLVQQAMPAHGQMAVVSFGARAVTELAPGRQAFTGFQHEVGRQASNLTEAIDRGVALIPQDSSGRLLVVSDGRWTGTDPGGALARAAARGIPVDFRHLGRTSAADLAFDRVDAPRSVLPGEAMLLTAWVRSPIAQEIRFEAWRGETLLAAEKRQVPSGLSRIF